MKTLLLLISLAIAGSSAVQFTVGSDDYAVLLDAKQSQADGDKACKNEGFDGLVRITDFEKLSSVSAGLAAATKSMRGTIELYAGGFVDLTPNQWLQDFSKIIDEGMNCVILTNWKRPAYAKTVFTAGVKPCSQGRYAVCGNLPVVEEDCPEQRAAFAAGDVSLDVDLQFDDTCKFIKRQCGENQCICVDAKTGEQKHGIIFPASADYNCEKKPKACIKDLAKQSLLKNIPSYIPQCDAKGRYLKMQCNRDDSECWCVKKRGKEIKGSRTSGKANC